MITLTPGILAELRKTLEAVDQDSLHFECPCDYADCVAGWEGCTVDVKPEVDALICAAVNALPDLLDAAEELARIKERLRGDCHYCTHTCELLSVPYRSFQCMDAANWEFAEEATR